MSFQEAIEIVFKNKDRVNQVFDNKDRVNPVFDNLAMLEVVAALYVIADETDLPIYWLRYAISTGKETADTLQTDYYNQLDQEA